MEVIGRGLARPLERLLCFPEMAANDARRNAEYDRIDAVSAQRRADWERRREPSKRQIEGVTVSRRTREDYHEQQTADHDRYMQERSEEHRWRTSAHEEWLAESRRLSRKSDRNLLRLIYGLAVATWVEVAAILVWA